MKKISVAKNKKNKIFLSVVGVCAFASAMVITTILHTHSVTAAAFEERRSSFYKVQMALENLGEDVSVYFKDLSDGFEYYYNPDKVLPSASLVKIPVMAALHAAIHEGKVVPTAVVRYRRKHLAGGSGSLRNSRIGRKYSICELKYRMIVESDNVATNMLTDLLGLGYINRKMIEWGLNETDMKRWIMDLRRRNAGIENNTTARELGWFLERIYRGEIVSKEASARMLETMKGQRRRNRLARYLPLETPVANKTGLMRNVVHDAGIIFNERGNYVLCVLTRDIPSSQAKRIIGEISRIIYDIQNNRQDSRLARMTR